MTVSYAEIRSENVRRSGRIVRHCGRPLQDEARGCSPFLPAIHRTSRTLLFKASSRRRKRSFRRWSAKAVEGLISGRSTRIPRHWCQLQLLRSHPIVLLFVEASLSHGLKIVLAAALPWAAHYNAPTKSMAEAVRSDGVG